MGIDNDIQALWDELDKFIDLTRKDDLLTHEARSIAANLTRYIYKVTSYLGDTRPELAEASVTTDGEPIEPLGLRLPPEETPYE